MKIEATQKRRRSIFYRFIFQCNAGYFGGIEYFIPKFHGARIKFEYDGTNYKTEAIKPVKQDSKFNLSYVHPLNKNFFLKLSYVRGNNLSFGFSI